ncbi:hypothetical protein QJS10_CPA02g01556 [Acorus calamus]|uniref:Uncharacterized protein n=1 Tax=Acorus calamus TaxID=4465 RepID=A0AAV9FCZ6_ACOCL|nr:hypothetical protein QJS10_CPA02g01556 [Acorus calamus]
MGGKSWVRTGGRALFHLFPGSEIHGWEIDRAWSLSGGTSSGSPRLRSETKTNIFIHIDDALKANRKKSRKDELFIFKSPRPSKPRIQELQLSFENLHTKESTTKNTQPCRDASPDS